jgi:hypothetical protein
MFASMFNSAAQQNPYLHSIVGKSREINKSRAKLLLPGLNEDGEVEVDASEEEDGGDTASAK